MPGHIRRNIAHKERFYVTYEEFTKNRPENRLIKTTLKKLQKVTTDERNKQDARELLLLFDGIQESMDYSQDLARIRIDRNSREYEKIMKWTEVILQGNSFLNFSDGLMARSILFAMEEVFENYVACQVKKYFRENWEVSSQDGVPSTDLPEMTFIRWLHMPAAMGQRKSGFSIRKQSIQISMKISGTVLKQRYGVTGMKANVSVDFHAAKDLYMEKGAQEKKSAQNVSRETKTDKKSIDILQKKHESDPDLSEKSSENIPKNAETKDTEAENTHTQNTDLGYPDDPRERLAEEFRRLL